MGKKINRIAVIVLTILLGELINAYMLTFFLPYKSESYPYRSTAITMILVVGVYYPAFTFINKYLKDFSIKYMKRSSGLMKGKIFGKLLAFIFALLFIFLSLANILYKRNGVSDAFKWVANSLN